MVDRRTHPRKTYLTNSIYTNIRSSTNNAPEVISPYSAITYISLAEHRGTENLT